MYSWAVPSRSVRRGQVFGFRWGIAVDVLPVERVLCITWDGMGKELEFGNV